MNNPTAALPEFAAQWTDFAMKRLLAVKGVEHAGD